MQGITHYLSVIKHHSDTPDNSSSIQMLAKASNMTYEQQLILQNFKVNEKPCRTHLTFWQDLILSIGNRLDREKWVFFFIPKWNRT